MVTFAAIRHLFPDATPQRACVVDDGAGAFIAEWDDALGVQPSLEQLTQSAAEVAAIEAARQQILGSFRSLPRGVQAFFEPVRAEVDAAISARDWQGVREIIATAPTPTSQLDAIRMEFAVMADSLLPQ